MKKAIAIIILGLLWCNVGFAECIKGDCINGYGTYTYANGSKYVGEWKDGKKHGQGTYTSQDGTKGKGEFKDNTPWNISLYGKYGNFTGKYVNGVKQ